MEDKPINERILKITGSSCIENDLELGQDISVNIQGNVIKIEEKDNQDGTKDRIFFIKQISAKITMVLTPDERTKE